MQGFNRVHRSVFCCVTDHQFLFNHLLRCPAGVGEWASPFLQVSSPLRTKEYLYHDRYRGRWVGQVGGARGPTERVTGDTLAFLMLISLPPFQISGDCARSGYSQDWGVELGLHGDWGGPVLDHFMAMLATLLLPVR
jgi:hypothetical protein